MSHTRESRRTKWHDQRTPTVVEYWGTGAVPFRVTEIVDGVEISSRAPSIVGSVSTASSRDTSPARSSASTEAQGGVCATAYDIESSHSSAAEVQINSSSATSEPAKFSVATEAGESSAQPRPACSVLVEFIYPPLGKTYPVAAEKTPLLSASASSAPYQAACDSSAAQLSSPVHRFHPTPVESSAITPRTGEIVLPTFTTLEEGLSRAYLNEELHIDWFKRGEREHAVTCDRIMSEQERPWLVTRVALWLLHPKVRRHREPMSRVEIVASRFCLIVFLALLGATAWIVWGNWAMEGLCVIDCDG